MGNFSGLNQEILALKLAIESLAGVGIYVFPSKQTSKAVAVAKPNFPPAGTQTQGIEIVIIPAEELTIAPMLNNGTACVRSHKIIIKQWDSNETTLKIIEPLVAVLMQLNYSVNVGLRIIPNPKLGNIESRNLTIQKTVINRRVNGN
ncbi:MAG: hypothetical protein EAZ18_00165 [Oscillatoriales cyanobacterium]|nr:MAG: hypothetical protein EAZ18_00165 [Oscillatoriales cyanobacterium]